MSGRCHSSPALAVHNQRVSPCATEARYRGQASSALGSSFDGLLDALLHGAATTD
jgi:hypothetical protein